jgi:hypothetical protein
MQSAFLSAKFQEIVRGNFQNQSLAIELDQLHVSHVSSGTLLVTVVPGCHAVSYI